MNKHMVDITALLGAAATFVGWLPKIAAGLSAIWYLTRLYEYAKAKEWF